MSPTKNIIPLYFAYLRHKRNNVNTYFHRFENQGRHTVHSHVLVWMKQLKNIALERIKATVPFDNTPLAHLVRHFFLHIIFLLMLLLEFQEKHFLFVSTLLSLIYFSYVIKYIHK